jgi:exosortase A
MLIQSSSWRRHLLWLGLAWFVLLVIFYRDARQIVSIWYDSSTFNHCFFIIPIIGWLVWQRRDGLAALTPAAWAWGLLPVAAGALGWLLGEAGGISFARHLGLVLIGQGMAVTLLGPQISRALAFPIFYALFMVPAGEALVPILQMVTAEICMVLLNLFGVAAYLDGIFITTPHGYFAVAVACSGVKFLIAMTAYGALVSNVCFISWRRRLAFMAASVIVPILANGVRAWGTIYAAKWTDVPTAIAFDHIVYGFVFFALVISLLMAAFWRWFDRPVDDPWLDPVALAKIKFTPLPINFTAPILFGLTALAPAWSAISLASGGRAVVNISLPQIPGWQLTDANVLGPAWQPRYVGADQLKLARYIDRQGRVVELAIAVYGYQAQGRELVGYGQGAEGIDGDWTWAEARSAPPGGQAVRLLAIGPVAREVLTFNLVGGRLAGGAVGTKLATLKARLLADDQRAVAILVSSVEPGRAGSARPAIDDFLRAAGPIEGLAARVTGGIG